MVESGFQRAEFRWATGGQATGQWMGQEIDMVRHHNGKSAGQLRRAMSLRASKPKPKDRSDKDKERGSTAPPSRRPRLDLEIDAPSYRPDPLQMIACRFAMLGGDPDDDHRYGLTQFDKALARQERAKGVKVGRPDGSRGLEDGARLVLIEAFLDDVIERWMQDEKVKTMWEGTLETYRFEELEDIKDLDGNPASADPDCVAEAALVDKIAIREVRRYEIICGLPPEYRDFDPSEPGRYRAAIP